MLLRGEIFFTMFAQDMSQNRLNNNFWWRSGIVDSGGAVVMLGL